jgi:tetratricopeptide (TPR) repeat protein/tRNA A-37 threonylcarbamoyl transferase component Bud32
MPDSHETGPHSSGAHDTLSDVAPIQRSLQLERGSLIGRYVVVEPIGSGGMSIVYLAYDPELDRRVALKVMRAASDSSSKLHERERMRLLREAQAMARLAHPNVVPIYDAGSIGERVFLAMHYVEGQTLTKWLEPARPWRQIVEFFVYAGRGLAAAHAAGLVHRDFKPDNVLVDREGRVRVTDFGLARPTEGPRSIDESDGEPRATPTTSSMRLERPVTLAGTVLGTPAYMSPEQHLAGEVDARTDQFSFCVALWEALTGERPFAGSTVGELAFAVTRGRVRQFPRESPVPARVRRVLERGLARKPDERFATMAALLEALQPRIRSKRALLAAGAVALVGVGAMLPMFLGGDAPAADPCASARTGLVDVYDGAQRAKTIDAIGATGVLAVAATERVAEVLDARAAEWRDAAIAACVAHRIDGIESAPAFDARMRCLARRRAEFVSMLGTLQRSNSERVVSAVSDLFDAVPPSECNDASRLLEASPPPDDPALRELADDVERRLLVIDADRQSDEATGTALEQLLRDAETTGWKPLLARVQAVKAQMHELRGEVAQSEALLRASARSAAAGQDDPRMLAALGTLAYTLAHLQGRLPEALEVAYLLELELERVEENPRTPSVFNSLGAVYQAAQQNERARDAYTKGLELLEVQGNDNPIRRASLLNNLGTIALGEGDALGARRSFEQALALSSATFGEDDQRLSDYHVNICQSYILRGELEAARPSCVRALALVDGPRVRDAAAAIRALIALANIDTSTGDFARATESLERVRPLAVATFGDNSVVTAIIDGIDAVLHLHQGKTAEATRLALASDAIFEAGGAALAPMRTSMLHVRGTLADTAGDHAKALELCDAATRLVPADLAEIHPTRLEPLICRGDALLHLGRSDDALAAYTQVVTILERLGGDPYIAARAHFGLAKIAATRGDAAAARASALAAQRHMTKIARRAPELVAEIDAWLEANP